MNNPVNPEAGDVPFPTDANEIALAEQAAKLIWRACFYFEHRYAARGRRFGASDAGYLVVIASHSAPIFHDQVDWLARVLAARGMPSCLLELQLRILARCGYRQNWSGAAMAEAGALQLLDIRRKWVSEARELHIQSICVQARVYPVHRWNSGLGLLIASAIADEAGGVAPSTAPLFGWLLEQAPSNGALAAVLGEARRG